MLALIRRDGASGAGSRAKTHIGGSGCHDPSASSCDGRSTAAHAFCTANGDGSSVTVVEVPFLPFLTGES